MVSFSSSSTYRGLRPWARVADYGMIQAGYRRGVSTPSRSAAFVFFGLDADAAPMRWTTLRTRLADSGAFVVFAGAGEHVKDTGWRAQDADAFVFHQIRTSRASEGFGPDADFGPLAWRTNFTALPTGWKNTG